MKKTLTTIVLLLAVSPIVLLMGAGIGELEPYLSSDPAPKLSAELDANSQIIKSVGALGIGTVPTATKVFDIVIPGTDGGAFIIRDSGGAWGPEVIYGTDGNAINDSPGACIIAGGGFSSWPNIIAGSGSRYSGIFAGYDNYGEGIVTSILGGAHQIIRDDDGQVDGDETDGTYPGPEGDIATHCTVAGGSYLRIFGGDYNIISGGTQNNMFKSCDYSGLYGGQFNVIGNTSKTVFGFMGCCYNSRIDNGSYIGLLSGYECEIGSATGTAMYCGIGSGYKCKMGTTGIVSRSFIGSGESCSITEGAHNFIGSGLTNLCSGNRSAIMCGSNIQCTNDYATAMNGYFSRATGQGSLVFGRNVDATANGSVFLADFVSYGGGAYTDNVTNSTDHSMSMRFQNGWKFWRDDTNYVTMVVDANGDLTYDSADADYDIDFTDAVLTTTGDANFGNVTTLLGTYPGLYFRDSTESNKGFRWRANGNQFSLDEMDAATGSTDLLLNITSAGTWNFQDSNLTTTGNVTAGGVSVTGTTGNTIQTTTLGAGATTLAITKNAITLTGDGGANTLATITGGAAGQTLTILFMDANITVTDTDAHTANTVDLSAGLTSADDTVLQLFFDGTSWYEISRSVN